MAQTIEKGIVRELREARHMLIEDKQRIADLERELGRLREDCRFVAQRARALSNTAFAINDVLIDAAGIDGKRIIEPELEDADGTNNG
jgi:hypothetical protein